MKSVKKPLTYFGISLLTLWIGALTFLKVQSIQRSDKQKSSEYTITEIMQTSMRKGALKTQHLAELIHLGSNTPINLYCFDLEEATKRLTACPLIYEAKVKKRSPSTLHIDYTAYNPIALVGDFYNTAIDETGHLFPISPFLSPKALPEVIFGIQAFEGWDKKPPHFNEALSLIALFKQHNLSLNHIDLSRLDSPSLGRRELILRTGHHTLRLPSEEYKKQLGNYLELAGEIRLHEEETGFVPKVIDLRIPNLAFINK
ncbi:MAG: Cell division protein FtsQ [Chlamydiia bacterium]|nr:Cell division protein FtsQ [Chlamydiia bacterium]MCH9615188.1 Cell division protein FtsQ [Chlamydiia bacterium]MCH9628490.1 Cell division protein FtsQ [Chlamydiia bacterium]